MNSNYLQINIYSYPEGISLGQRVLAKRWINQTMFGNTAEEINKQVEEVKNLWKRDVFFKTKDI